MNDLAAAGPVASTWRDYLELCKPRVVLLMLVCTAAGMLLATQAFAAFDLLAITLLGVGLVASSAAVVNHVADQHVDARMARTRNRPVATGRISNQRALAFSAVMGVAGVVLLALFVNPLTAWLNVASWVGYGLIYTLYLKRATSQNIVIGGLFGAAPPLFGWTAVTNSIEAGGLLLVMIIFVWTPPHFWALAIDRRDEYARVDVPMLPITHGVRHTQWQILFYTLILFATSLLPFAIGMSGLLYLAAAIALGAGFLYWAVALLAGLRPRAAIETFRYSIFYLLMLFVALLVDHFLVTPSPVAAVLPTLQ